MKRYQLVHGLSWRESICSVLFESDDVTVVERLEAKCREVLNEEYDVVDTWDRRNTFAASARALFKSEAEALKWLMKEAEQRRSQLKKSK